MSFCLMKKERRWESCQAVVAVRMTSWMTIQRMTRELVASEWSRNSASRSWGVLVYLQVFEWKAGAGKKR